MASQKPSNEKPKEEYTPKPKRRYILCPRCSTRGDPEDQFCMFCGLDFRNLEDLYIEAAT